MTEPPRHALDAERITTPVDYAGHTGPAVDIQQDYGIKQGGVKYPEDLEVAVYRVPSMFDRLPEIAIQINHELALNGFPENEALTRQMLAIGEEIGEFQGAVRRFYGMARRQGSWEKVLEEWADVVITAFVTANILGMSRSQMEKALETKLGIIFSRGWHETVQDNVDTAQEQLDFTDRLIIAEDQQVSKAAGADYDKVRGDRGE